MSATPIKYGFYRAKAARLRRRAHRMVRAVLAERAQKAIRAISRMNLIRRPASPIVGAEACRRSFP
jgi:hypothetical protein